MQDSFARNFNARLNTPAGSAPLHPDFSPRSDAPQMPALDPRSTIPIAPVAGAELAAGHAPNASSISGSDFFSHSGSGFHAQVSPAPVSPQDAGPSGHAIQTLLPHDGMDLEKYLIEQERSFIVQALERSNWNLTEAAKILCMTFRSIRYRVAKLAIERPGKGIDFTES